MRSLYDPDVLKVTPVIRVRGVDGEEPCINLEYFDF